MRTTTSTTGATHKARTYLPESESREVFRGFAEFMRKLEAFLAKDETSTALLVDPNGNTRPIPDEIFRILDQVANALAAGEGITIAPQGMSMTTQQAADFLGISRPTLVRLLESGAIPHERPNRHRRVRLQDLVHYQTTSRSERRDALRDLRKANVTAEVQVGDPAEVKRLMELDSE